MEGKWDIQDSHQAAGSSAPAGTHGINVVIAQESHRAVPATLSGSVRAGGGIFGDI